MRKRLGVATVAVAIAGLAVFGSTAASAPRATTEVRVVTLPIANGLPLDLGIRKGFFAQQGIEIKKTTLQSGNDVVLALANNNGDIGYLGFVPMYIAVTSGIPMTLVAASEVEGTNARDNWQNILVKGSSSIRTPRDLAGKTIAVNALKGVGEVMIKAAMEKIGVRPNAFRLTALPFPQMRSALNNGQVDAIWTPEPFLSQAINIDGARSIMAPGPVLGRYWPIGGYTARQAWRSCNPADAQRFRTGINRALSYAQAHPSEIRAMLPPGTGNDGGGRGGRGAQGGGAARPARAGGGGARARPRPPAPPPRPR
jgi:NitT/TauT family transport system substrate-binding protein